MITMITKHSANQAPGVAKAQNAIVAVKNGTPLISKGPRRLAIA